MVTIGFSKPYVAKYSNNGTSVTYTGGMDLARGVKLSLEVKSADENDFYADNVISETDSGTFTSGTVKMTVDGLENAAASLIFGLQETESVNVGNQPVAMQGYGEASEPPYVGVGCVRKTRMKGIDAWWPFILPKVKFALAGDEMNTQEKSIDWQTQELEGTVFRDDTTAKNWKVISAEGMASEEAAYNVLKAYLGGASA